MIELMADLDLHSWRSPGDSVFPRPKPGRTSLHRANPYECLGLHQFPEMLPNICKSPMKNPG